MVNEPPRPYYDHDLALANKAERQRQNSARLAAIRELLGFGKCVLVPNPERDRRVDTDRRVHKQVIIDQ